MHDVKDCLMYLIKSSRTCDLCLRMREQMTKDANGHAAMNLDLTPDWKLAKSRQKIGQSCNNLFSYHSKTKSSTQQPFSFLINWESDQNKWKDVSAELRTCNSKQFRVARRQIYMLLPPFNTMFCHLSNVSTGREGSISWLCYHYQMTFSWTKPHYY